MVVDVLRQAPHVPFLGRGSLVVSSMVHILDLEGEVVEAVEPSLATSSTVYGGSMIGPFVFKITPFICTWCPVRLWVLSRKTLWCWVVPSTNLTSHWLWCRLEDLVHSFHYELYHGFCFVHLVPACVAWAGYALALRAGYRLILPIDVTIVI